MYTRVCMCVDIIDKLTYISTTSHFSFNQLNVYVDGY